MQIEIVNPNGKVSYRRPEGHPDIAEALSRPGYSVRFQLPRTGPPEYGLAWGILRIQRTYLHHVSFDHHTRKIVVWPATYVPTSLERKAADEWTAREHDAPASDFPDLVKMFGLVPAHGPADKVEAIREAVADDALMDECLGLLKVGYEKGDPLREVMRRVCGNFALRALGIQIPGRPADKPGQEESLPEVIPPPPFPVAGAFAWLFAKSVPEVCLVQIIQQHDAFEWEVLLRPKEPKEPEARVIAQTIQLDELTEGEQIDLKAGTLTKPHCRSDDDGHCTWRRCPQILDGEPEATGRHCPFCTMAKDDEEAI